MSGQRSETEPAEILSQLKQLHGFPVRLTVLDPTSKERLTRISGVLAGVGPTLVVDRSSPAPALAEGLPVTIEFVVKGDHVACYTQTVSVRGIGFGQLALKFPSALEMLHRRRHPRVDLNVPVRLMLAANAEHVPALLRDISAGGASAFTDRPLSAGQRVQLVFPVASGMYFHDLEGETIRCTDAPEGRYIVAMQFRCGPELETALADWVNARLNTAATFDRYL